MCSKPIQVYKTNSNQQLLSLVKMGIHLCYKWDKPKAMVKVEENYRSLFDLVRINVAAQKLD